MENAKTEHRITSEPRASSNLILRFGRYYDDFSLAMIVLLMIAIPF
jgi:hypothetical protein